jgi:hypothetical protein
LERLPARSHDFKKLLADLGTYPADASDLATLLKANLSKKNRDSIG